MPNNKAFAENVVAEGGAADGNPKLYRVSTGHGGLFCEACHGSTHAEWPSANPNANDNLPAKDLQGHSGYIAECQVCHEPTDASLPLGNNGPHGMHAIVDLEPAAGTGFLPDDRWNIQHRNYRTHGAGLRVLPRHQPDGHRAVAHRRRPYRALQEQPGAAWPGCASGQTTAVIPKGTPVGCGMCHRQK